MFTSFYLLQPRMPNYAWKVLRLEGKWIAQQIQPLFTKKKKIAESSSNTRQSISLHQPPPLKRKRIKRWIAWVWQQWKRNDVWMRPRAIGLCGVQLSEAFLTRVEKSEATRGQFLSENKLPLLHWDGVPTSTKKSRKQLAFLKGLEKRAKHINIQLNWDVCFCFCVVGYKG